MSDQLLVNMLLVSPQNQAVSLDLELDFNWQNTTLNSRVAGCYIGLYGQHAKMKNLIKVAYDTSNRLVKKVLYLIFEFQNSDKTRILSVQ